MTDREKRYAIVVGIELGASFSGYAYSFYADYEENPLKVNGHTWSLNNGQFYSHKIPTTILFDPKKTIHSFGYEAEEKYVSLQLDGKHKDWFLFQRFIDRSQVNIIINM